MLMQFLKEVLQLTGGLIFFYFVYIFFTKKNDKPAADTPSMAHTALRELVERAVDEARKLPGLGNTVSSRTQNTSISEQNYEHLLASAIINKVIEKCQKENIDGNGNDLDEKSRKFSKNKSVMSLDDKIDGDCSSIVPESLEDSTDGTDGSGFKIHRRTRIQDPLSLMIEEQIEEVTTVYTSAEDPGTVKTNLLNFRNAKRVPFPEFGMDIIDPSQESSEESQDEVDEAVHVDHITPVESWEENWLFQKKKISIKSEPVAMLVPNPSAEYRALIGDKDAEDTSDLSEFSAHSDEEVDDELIQAIDRALPESSNAKEDQSPHNHIEEKIKSSNTKIINGNGSITTSVNEVGVVEKELIETDQDCSKKNKETNEQIEQIEQIVNDKFMKNVNNINDNVVHCKIVENLPNDVDEALTAEIVPKTPSPTPIRNSLSENDQSSVSLVSFLELNKKLVSMDMHSEESSDVDEVYSSATENSFEEINNNEINSEVIGKTKGKQEIIEDIECAILDNRRCREAYKHAEVKGMPMSHKNINDDDDNDDDLELSAPPRPGTIAEREHKKWENAPPIQNNPYSQENIKKRLLERQYVSRPSEVGNSGVLPSSPSPPLQIVLGANRPDIKRFGRDYYINDSKSPAGERQNRSGTSNSSRPSSSLSHRSSSTGSDFEQQESFEPIEAASKSLELTQNNKFLERERKNSKNEINAKLNKQGNFDNISTMLGTKNTLTDNNQRKIRRIDLKAYGFENEFNNNNNNNNNNKKDSKDMQKRQHQRIPNKLDLRLFGYDEGLRRAQSNNHLESKVNNNNNSFVNLKTNIQPDDNSNLFNYGRIDDYNWNKSAENVSGEKKIMFEQFDPIKSAKSVPNISTIEYCYDSKQELPASDEDNDEIYNNKNTKLSVIKLIEEESCPSNNSYESDSQSSKESEEFSQRLSASRDFKCSLKSLEETDKFIDEELSMPSVKQLAQAFNNTSYEIISAPRVTKSVNNCKQDRRPKTPEVHIIGTPRQMHSLTARSLPKEFREGLRQISNKPNAPTSMIIEQSKKPAGATEKNSIYNEKPGDIINVIAPGKLKNDIQFWEQLQKKDK